jgi:hypothetical protein
MRLTEDESPDVVLARLRANEPTYTMHPQAPENPASAQHRRGPHKGAAGRSVGMESRADFEQRHAAWQAAVEREEKRKAGA